jgi:hypothetical protein
MTGRGRRGHGRQAGRRGGARRAGRLVQPGIKCRGREYLRIIYGPEYTRPDNLARLRGRFLNHKRSLAIREYALGLEALDRLAEGSRCGGCTRRCSGCWRWSRSRWTRGCRHPPTVGRRRGGLPPEAPHRKHRKHRAEAPEAPEAPEARVRVGAGSTGCQRCQRAGSTGVSAHQPQPLPAHPHPHGLPPGQLHRVPLHPVPERDQPLGLDGEAQVGRGRELAGDQRRPGRR